MLGVFDMQKPTSILKNVRMKRFLFDYSLLLMRDFMWEIWKMHDLLVDVENPFDGLYSFHLMKQTQFTPLDRKWSRHHCDRWKFHSFHFAFTHYAFLIRFEIFKSLQFWRQFHSKCLKRMERSSTLCTFVQNNIKEFWKTATKTNGFTWKSALLLSQYWMRTNENQLNDW